MDATKLLMLRDLVTQYIAFKEEAIDREQERAIPLSLKIKSFKREIKSLNDVYGIITDDINEYQTDGSILRNQYRAISSLSTKGKKYGYINHYTPFISNEVPEWGFKTGHITGIKTY